jgi:hypothetical protein
MFKKKRVLLLLLAGSLLAAIIPAGLYSQEITGNISGTVTDPSGAVIPDAKVVVNNVLTGTQRSTTTTTAGVFFFTSLPTGDYRLTVEKAGFKTSETTGIHLSVNDRLNFPIALEVGETTQTISVTGEVTALQTETGEVSNLVGNAQMVALPLNGRYFGQLVDLVPGVAPDDGRVRGNATNVSFNGNQSNSNLYLIDGQFDMDNGNNGDTMVTPSADSIEEFKVLRNNYSAEFGEATGAIVNVITKSGTKDFHGSLFEFGRNDALNAAGFFLNANNQKKSELRQHEFGGTVGGPFWIPGKYNTDRTKDFFFLSLQYRREVNGNVLTDTVPTLGQRQGILQTPCVTGAPGCDPMESPVDEANVDPAQIDPNAAALLRRYPLPNANYEANGFNFITSSPEGSSTNHVAFRWDHNIGEKATLMVNYMQSNNPSSNSNTGWGDDSFPSVSSDWFYGSKLGSIKLTYMISPRTVNDFQVGYSGNEISFVTSKASDPVLASRDGFTYTELFPETSGSFPTFWGVDNFGALVHTAPFYNRTDNIQIKDDISHTVGKHNSKAGFFVRFSRKREPANGGDDETAGTLGFNSFNDLLLGNLSEYTEEQTLNEVPSRGRDIAVYFHDTYKVRSNLTLDLGLRWQYLGQVFSAHDNIAGFYPSRYDPSRCSVAAFDPNGLVDPTKCDVLNGIVTPKSPGVTRSTREAHYKDFEPRVGFSWAPGASQKYVLRGGFGIYHGRDAFSQVSSAGQQPPFDLYPRLTSVTFRDLAPYNPDTPQPPVDLKVLDPSYPSPVSYQYSLGIQYEFMRDTSLEVNYVGSRQIHLGRNRNINQIPAQYQLGVYDAIFNGGPLVPATVRPFLGYGIINVNERAANSRYNSLQAMLSRRFQAGLQFQAAYTFSRNLGNTINQDTEGRASPVQDAYHPDLDKALTDSDITHSLVLNYVWQMPFFKNSGRFMKNVLGGWELNGITMFRSGRPREVCLDNDYAGLADGGVCLRPNLVGNPNLASSDRMLGRFFNTDAFVFPELGTFGNAQRNLVRGPGIHNWDMSLFKNIEFPWLGRHSGWIFAEKAMLQFRAEFFNVWNHTQWSGINTTFRPKTDENGNPIPGETAGNSSFGKVRSALSPRQIQLGLRLVF